MIAWWPGISQDVLRYVSKSKERPKKPKSKENLQFKSEAMGFASYSGGNKPLIMKEELGYNFRETFRKPSEKFKGNKEKDHLCSRCGGKPLCINQVRL